MPTFDSPPSAPLGLGDFFWRLGVLWPYKLVGASVGMSLFFVAYFHLLNHPKFPVTVMPLTRWDAAIPFSPLWLLPYVSLWVYVTIPPFIMTRGRELALYGVAAAVMSVLGLAIFFFWPTTLPPLDIDWTRHPSVQFLKSVDAAGNACPSLHVAFAIFTAFWLHRLLRETKRARLWQVLNNVWAGAIVLSTLGTHQHVVWDVVAGTALGVIVAVGHAYCSWQIARRGT
ncbi:MAG TPA: phosphatase PAP2 family protein [Opitutaceae bacterium]|nr:phosphatase PAP2 family protein [Opitutaceae bacterium]